MYDIREELIGIDLHGIIIPEHRSRVSYIGVYIRETHFDAECIRLRLRSVVCRTDEGLDGTTLDFADSAVSSSIHTNFEKESTKDSTIESTIETTFARTTRSENPISGICQRNV